MARRDGQRLQDRHSHRGARVSHLDIRGSRNGAANEDILDLKMRYSTLAQQFAEDSSKLHTAWATIGKAHLEAVSAWQDERAKRERLEIAFAAFRNMGLFGRLWWLVTGQ